MVAFCEKKIAAAMASFTLTLFFFQCFYNVTESTYNTKV